MKRPNPKVNLGQIPKIDKLLKMPGLVEWENRLISPVRTRIAQQVLELARERGKRFGSLPPVEELAREVALRFTEATTNGLQRAINATGIVLHTNLGRAPVNRESLESLARDLSGYCTLEVDRVKHSRGSRTLHVEQCLRHLTGAEAALVVNNNAAALFLIMHALAGGKEVLVSRGEIVQIGGGFKIHEILQASGAQIVEVGTTNITSLKDYENRLKTGAAMVLKVHQSNFHMVGHVKAPPMEALATSCRKAKALLVVDQGSGCLLDRPNGDPSIRALLKSGCDLVCFSGDKLLGGSQAGVILGHAALVEQLKSSPLYRALRIGKWDLFLMEQSLHLHLTGKPTLVETLLAVTAEEVKHRAENLLRLLDKEGVRARLAEGKGSVGGGSNPAEELPTFLVEISVADSEQSARQLSRQTPPIFVRKGKNRLSLDLRTVFLEDEPALLEGLKCLS